MLDLIKACESESGLDFLQESFILTDEQKDAILQQRIVFWTNAMAEDIEQGNDFNDFVANRMEDIQQEHVFDDLMANWTETQRCRFIAVWDNNEGLLTLTANHKKVRERSDRTRMSWRLRINAKKMMTTSPSSQRNRSRFASSTQQVQIYTY